MKKTALAIGILGLGLLGGCDSAPEEKAKAPAPAAMPTFAVTAVPVEWKTYSDDDLHFSFESPISLEVNKSMKGLPEKTVEMRGQDQGGNMDIRVAAQDIGNLELDLSAEFDKKVQALKDMSPALRNLQVTTGPVTLSDAAGFMAEGTASMPGRIPYAVKMLKLRKDAVLMDILLQYNPAEDTKAQAQRVLDSMSFTN